MRLDDATKKRIAAWGSDPVAFVHDVLRWETVPGSRLAKPLTLEPFQREFLRKTDVPYRGVLKARQIGYSFLFAIEVITRAVLRPGYGAVFVSYNQEEARRKIQYIHDLHDRSPALQAIAEFKKNKDVVKIRRRDSRVWSVIETKPGNKAPRGVSGADIYLDELAFYEHDESIYTGSLALMVRAPLAQMTVASTPNGRSGTFWECLEGPLSRGYWKQNVPWWESELLCNDVARAAQAAPGMSTYERVEEFGTLPLLKQFDGHHLPGFQQEYELEFIDESTSFYPISLLEENTVPGQTLCVPEDYGELRRRRRGTLVAGYDFGLKQDNSEIVVVDRWLDPETGKMAYTPLMVISMDRVRSQDQIDRILHMMGQVVPGTGAEGDEEPEPLISYLWMDATGLGHTPYDHLAEYERDRIGGVNFTNRSKEYMAGLTRRALDRNRLDLPDPEAKVSMSRVRQAREFRDQIHSIRRIPMQNKVCRYEAESTTHHGDQFWALALAMLCADGDLAPERRREEVRILG